MTESDIKKYLQMAETAAATAQARLSCTPATIKELCTLAIKGLPRFHKGDMSVAELQQHYATKFNADPASQVVGAAVGAYIQGVKDERSNYPAHGGRRRATSPASGESDA